MTLQTRAAELIAAGYYSSSQTGWHGYFISTRRLDTGKLYDAAGNHIGELLGG